MRIVFFGTPEFAVPTLRMLLTGPHDVVGVVSQPDRPRGRGRKLHPSPVSDVALAAQLPLLRPERIGAPEVVSDLAAMTPDLGVVVAFGQFLPKRVRELPSQGYLINGHASILPDFRGAAPIAHAILAGKTETGVSVMRVEKEMDAGPVALVHRLEIGETEDCGSLTDRLADTAATAIAAGLGAIADERVDWSPQDPSRATFAPKIGVDDARIDWNQPAEALVLRVRAMAPSPGARTAWASETLRILAAHAVPDACGAPAGSVTHREGKLAIATGQGWLLPTTLQRAGGRPLATADFERGRPLTDGTQLG